MTMLQKDRVTKQHHGYRFFEFRSQEEDDYVSILECANHSCGATSLNPLIVVHFTGFLLARIRLILHFPW